MSLGEVHSCCKRLAVTTSRTAATATIYTNSQRLSGSGGIFLFSTAFRGPRFPNSSLARVTRLFALLHPLFDQERKKETTHFTEETHRDDTICRDDLLYLRYYCGGDRAVVKT